MRSGYNMNRYVGLI